ncbi:MAG: hypothetical protein CL678_19085 [Bdellovibrionaceae bacterium]|nr:hypothetical protein [Pseudobdellovibrionaceae bacterium]
MVTAENLSFLYQSPGWLIKMSKIIAGVIGLGFGGHVHVPALLAHPNIEKVFVYARREEKGKAMEALDPRVHAIYNRDEFWNQNLDLITIALPASSAFSEIKEALERGIPVLTEKPLGKDFLEAQTLFDLAKKFNASHAVDFQFMELESFQKLKSEIDSLSQIRSIHFHWSVNSYVIRNKIWSWKLSLKEGGGVLALLGTHFFYNLESLFEKVTLVSAKGQSTLPKDFPVPPGEALAPDTLEMNLSIHWKGTTFPLVAMITNNSQVGYQHSYRIVGNHELFFNNPTSDYMNGFFLEKNGKRVYEDVPFDGDGRIVPFQRLLGRFIEGLKTKNYTRPTFEHGVRVQELVSLFEKQNS